MKLLKRMPIQAIAILVTVIAIIYLAGCTNEDQIFDTPPVNSTTDLIAINVTVPPTIDGVVDAIWENSPKLQFDVVVPDPTGDLFRGYVGNIIPSVTLRSAYDSEHIYFLAEWEDPTQSLIRQPWYFDHEIKLWKTESGIPTFTDPKRPAFYEDKMAMLWNVGNSVTGWNTATCFKSCHTGLSSADGFARHYTNNPSERIDMWHWKAVRGGLNVGQFDDQFQDNTYPNGRKGDTGVNGYSNNTQDLMQPDVGTVAVPKYVIPGRSNYNWILGTEITDGTAKTITAVDEEGVLTYEGGTIDPNVGTDYQRIGTGVGPKAIPFIIMKPFEGSRGDISAAATYTGNGWILEYKRALKTGDTEKQDVDFSSLADQYFGFAIFENAQIAHGIKPNLVLKFKK